MKRIRSSEKPHRASVNDGAGIGKTMSKYHEDLGMLVLMLAEPGTRDFHDPIFNFICEQSLIDADPLFQELRGKHPAEIASFLENYVLRDRQAVMAKQEREAIRNQLIIIGEEDVKYMNAGELERFKNQYEQYADEARRDDEQSESACACSRMLVALKAQLALWQREFQEAHGRAANSDQEMDDYFYSPAGRAAHAKLLRKAFDRSTNEAPRQAVAGRGESFERV
jgi:hypothetical protein